MNEGEAQLPPPGLPPRDSRAMRLSRLVRAALRAEDLVLIVWVAFQPVVLAALGHVPAESGGAAADPLGGHGPLAGLVELASVAAALLCVATRPADTAPGDASSLMDRGVVGPLTGGILLVTVVGSQDLFGDGEAGFGLVLAAVIVALLLRAVLPPLRVAWRRALVTPYVLVSASLFGGLIGAVGDLFDLRALFAGDTAGTIQALPLLGGVLIAFCAVYYVMLVYAPRQLAQADGGAVAWLIRFAVFVGAEVLAASVFGVTA